jgi:23S rRNA (cytosine1962-C5)-methyltransferase
MPEALSEAKPEAVVTLSRTGPHRVLAGHLWVYRNEIAQVTPSPANGDLVEVRDAGGRSIGRGYFNEQSQITIRLLSRAKTAIDERFWQDRITQALAYRKQVMPGATALRLINSEGDLLPGLIVDRYGDHLVVQTTTMGMDRQQELIVAILRDLLKPKVIIERNDMPVRKFEGIDERKGVILGESDGAVRMQIGAATFAFNLLDPHKTGFYLDQQANYARVSRHIRSGARVLDAFCHLAGFGIHAALAGANRVIAVDSAAQSIAGARAAAELSGVSDKLDLRNENAFDLLKALQSAGEQFDAIILDPPTFTRTRDAVEGALRGYKEIHLRALLMLPIGGKLATFTCSHHVSGILFLETVMAAASDAGVCLRLEETLGAGPDHPVLPGIPETNYLKGYILTVVDRW